MRINCNYFLRNALLAACCVSLISCASKKASVSKKSVVSKKQAPVAYWSFDEVNNRTAKDLWGKNDGVLIGRAPASMLQEGVAGKAIYCKNGQNFIEIPHSPELSLTNQFTIECAVKPYSIKGYNTILWKGDRTVKPQQINYYVDIKDGKVELKGKKKDGAWFVYSTAEPVVKVGHWANIVITWNKGDIAIYVNGKKEPIANYEQRLESGYFVTNDKPMMIGSGRNFRGVAGYPFNGLIDEVKIYKTTDFVTPEYVAAAEDKRNELQRKTLKRKLANLAKRIDSISKKISDKTEEDYSTIAAKLSAFNDFDELSSENEKIIAGMEGSLLNIEKNLGYKHFYYKNVTDESPFILAVLPTSKRLVAKAAFYDELVPLATSAKVSMARNEYDGFQVVALGNPNEKIEQVQVKIGQFKHENGQDQLPADAITCGWMKKITTTEPDIDVEYVGPISDVIMEGQTAFDIDKADFTSVYFKVHADKNTKPGLYQGTVTFNKDKVKAAIDVTVNVYNFTLPETNSTKIAFCFFKKFYERWYGGISDEQNDYINKFLLSYRIPPSNIYSSAASTPSIEELDKYSKKGANFSTFRYYANEKILSPEKLQALVDSYKESINAVKKAGHIDNAYFYSYDELGANMKKFPAAKQLLAAMRKEFPDLKCLETSVPYTHIQPYFNAWCPIWDYFTEPSKMKYINEVRERGDEVWWYCADDPPKPFPNFFIDYPVFDLRIIMTLSYMYKVDGVLYWCINREWQTNNVKGEKWPAVAWKPYIVNVFSKKRVHKNGMGNFMYPGPKGIIYPSIRLENLRDGLEDFEYYHMLKNLVAKEKAANGSSSLTDKAEKLLKIPAKVAVAVNHYSPDPSHLIKYRNKVAEMIEELLENQ